MRGSQSRLSTFVGELKRRHVFRVAITYGVVAFVVAQVADISIPALGMPQWTITLVVLALILGFPLVLALAWSFDITPDGLQRTGSLPQPSETGLVEAEPDVAKSTQWSDVVLSAAPPFMATDATTTAERTGFSSVSTAPPKLERVERASLAQLRDELRTPATAIVSYSQMLLADLVAPDRERLRADLDRIRKAGELVGARIEHLLDPDHPTWRASGPERERMVSRMRHDLRTPLNAVIGYSELILEEQITSDEDHAVAADVRRILASGRHLLFAVDGLVRSAAADGSPSGGFGRHSSTAQEVLAKLRPVEADPGAIPLRQGRVLVIDDVEANRELIAHQLARQGYTVARAASGREGLELLAQTEFDVVLSDLMMDEMDGIDLLRRLKNDPALSDVPVIMISALDELDSVVRCIQLGAVDFVVKPVDPVLLAASIGSILELQHLRERERNYAEALQRLQDWIDQLLRQTYPVSIADRLRAGERGIVESSTDACVLVAELQGGVSFARGGPVAQVERVGRVFSRFDMLAEERGIEVIRATGRFYFAAAGLPQPRGNHEAMIGELALALQEETRHQASTHDEPLRLRIGIDTGAVVAGIIMSRHVSFDIWGEAVETARLLLNQAAADTIHVSAAVYGRLRDTYTLTTRGLIEVPGKGEMKTYVLQGRAAVASAPIGS